MTPPTWLDAQDGVRLEIHWRLDDAIGLTQGLTTPTRRRRSNMSRLVILMVLGLAFTATLGEAKENHIHVTAQVVQQTFTGDLAHPQLSDQLITSVVLRNEDDEEVGTGTGACSVVSVPPLATRLQCLLTAVFANGEIIFGGVAPLPEANVAAHFGILGGTDDFRKASGEAILTVVSPTLQDAVFDLK
jgi:hypothetical protein